MSPWDRSVTGERPRRASAPGARHREPIRQSSRRGRLSLGHGELLRQGRGLELDARKALAQTVVQILADPPLLVAADVKQFFFQLPALDCGRQHVGDRLEKVNVVVGEFPSLRRVRSEHTVGPAAAMDDHAQTAHDTTMERKLRVAKTLLRPRSSTITGAFDSKCESLLRSPASRDLHGSDRPSPPAGSRPKGKALPVGSNSITVQNSQPRIACTRRTASSNSVARAVPSRARWLSPARAACSVYLGFESNHRLRALRGQLCRPLATRVSNSSRDWLRARSACFRRVMSRTVAIMPSAPAKPSGLRLMSTGTFEPSLRRASSSNPAAVPAKPGRGFRFHRGIVRGSVLRPDCQGSRDGRSRTFFPPAH